MLATLRCKLPATMTQNVRKRVRMARERERQKAAQQDEVETLRASARLVAETKRAAEVAARAAEVAANEPKHNFRHTSHQVDVIAYGKHKWLRATTDAYKKATLEYENLISGDRARGDGGAKAIADKYNEDLPHGAKHLTGGTIQRLVLKKLAGLSRGPGYV
jgi:hypothetical protein